MSVVLMYHALFRGSDTSAIDQEDLPYAVSEADFCAQLDLLATRQVGVYSPGEAPEVVITFDDGHQSNLEIAATQLQARGLSAYFFITSGFIGRRAHFLSAAELHALAAVPGMVIGSHGVTHRFFDDLSESDSRQELEDSRHQLETITGRDCHSISFPGGRYTVETLKQLQGAGYRQWFGSQIGTVDASSEFIGSPSAGPAGKDDLSRQAHTRPVNRVAVRRTTAMDEFARMIKPDPAYYRHHRRRGQAKTLVRRVLGNRLYHGLYKSLSAR